VIEIRSGRQNAGIGPVLVREGLAACAALGEAVVVLLGHPHCYPRFGFVPAATKGLSCEYPVPDEVFMVTEWVPGALRGRTGLVKYHPEFARV
jgi:putative acetyltransferase